MPTLIDSLAAELKLDVAGFGASVREAEGDVKALAKAARELAGDLEKLTSVQKKALVALTTGAVKPGDAIEQVKLLANGKGALNDTQVSAWTRLVTKLSDMEQWLKGGISRTIGGSNSSAAQAADIPDLTIDTSKLKKRPLIVPTHAGVPGKKSGSGGQDVKGDETHEVVSIRDKNVLFDSFQPEEWIGKENYRRKMNTVIYSLSIPKNKGEIVARYADVKKAMIKLQDEMDQVAAGGKISNELVDAAKSLGGDIKTASDDGKPLDAGDVMVQLSVMAKRVGWEKTKEILGKYFGSKIFNDEFSKVISEGPGKITEDLKKWYQQPCVIIKRLKVTRLIDYRKIPTRQERGR